MGLSPITRLFLVSLAALLAGAIFLSARSDAVRAAMGAIFSGAEKEAERDKAGSEATKQPEGEEQAGEVRLTANQINLIGLKTAIVEQKPVTTDLLLNAEIAPNQDRIVQVLPKTAGVVRELKKDLGDRVQENELLAVIDSRDLAEAVAAYLGARSKADLAQNQFQREESLWKKKVSAEQDYLTAKQAAMEAVIDVRAAEQKLVLLGLDPATAVAQPPAGGAIPVPVTAPFDGTIIEKRIAIGDQVNDQSPLFRIANLDRVWVIANVFEKDLRRVAIGQPATVTVRAYPERKFAGKITWISEVIDESTRTLKVRVELDNRERLLKPGSFAHVSLSIVAQESGVTVPASAVQRQKSESIVFIDVGGGLYERRAVKLGARSPETVEVIEGLRPGETVVTSGSFLLKSELEKSSFGEGD